MQITGQLSTPVIKPKHRGEGFDIIAIDEANVPWVWNYFDGCWAVNASAEALERGIHHGAD